MSKIALLESLGICVLPEGQKPENYHLIDVDGDGVLDVIYDGWNADCVGGVGEGVRTKIYLTVDARATTILDVFGYVAQISRANSMSPIYFALHDPGCCGDTRRVTEFYAPRIVGVHLGFEVYAKTLFEWHTEEPVGLLAVPLPFSVVRASYNLRWSPEVDDTSTQFVDLYGRSGNVLAAYPAGAQGIALAEKRDETGRMWWFVLMDSSPPPLTATSDDVAHTNSSVAARRFGWMSSRYLTVVPVELRARSPTPERTPN